MEATPTRSQQLVENFQKNSATALIASMAMNKPEDYSRYGYAAGTETSDGLLKIEQIIEKPGVGKIDSDYALIGGSIYEPEMFNAIEEAMQRLAKEGSNRELVYIDAVKILLERGKTCYAS